MGFIQTSAKTGLNIDKLFSEIGKTISYINLSSFDFQVLSFCQKIFSFTSINDDMHGWLVG